MKAIIFDFDGVIHDTLHDLYKVHISTLEQISLEEMKANVFNGNPRVYFEKFTPEQQTNFENAWQKHYNTLKLTKPIRDELIKLSQNYSLFVVSSNTEINLNKYFKNNNFTNVFTGIYGSETHKSKVEKFKILFNKNNLKADECIFVTDTLGDILEANNVNMKTIAVDFGYHKREKLEQGNPYKIVSDFKDIRTFVNKL